MAHYIFEDGLKLRQKVRALVLDQAGMLLLIRPHGYRAGEWTFAGGGVEQGETPGVAIARELREELGLSHWLEIRRLTAANRFIYTPKHKAKRRLDHDGQDAVMYSVLVPKGFQPRLQEEEIAEACWFSRLDALNVLPVAAQRTVLGACLTEISDLSRSELSDQGIAAGPARATRAA